jgi:phthiodiolone/phenolphthiodiolone dimycocerosates ketoreductase
MVKHASFRVGVPTLDERTALDYITKVPRPLLREMYVAGTPDEVIEQLAVWRDHGLRYAVLTNGSVAQRSLRKG